MRRHEAMAQEDGSKKDVTAKEEIRAGQHQREIKQDGTTSNESFHCPTSTTLKAQGTYYNPRVAPSAL